MQQPQLPTIGAPKQQQPLQPTRKPPSPQELIALYESKGMESQEAASKVIEDLQTMLYRGVASKRGRKEKFMAETSRKLDSTQARLAVLEKKVDLKPGYASSLAIGMAAGPALKGLGAVWGSVALGVGEIWSSIRTATKSSPA